MHKTEVIKDLSFESDNLTRKQKSLVNKMGLLKKKKKPVTEQCDEIGKLKQDVFYC